MDLDQLHDIDGIRRRIDNHRGSALRESGGESKVSRGV
jgi:hypothetical protein